MVASKVEQMGEWMAACLAVMSVDLLVFVMAAQMAVGLAVLTVVGLAL